MARSITIEAPAKVNLTLEVVRRRDDGYHQVALLLQTVSLFDSLRLEEARELSLECSDPALGGEDNLALRAARLLGDAAGVRGGARMTLEKGIPPASGLGGGSSDAAAALAGLNRLWRAGLSTEELAGLAGRIGSDVPFFLQGGTALCLGRGERVEPLPAANLGVMLLVCPDIPLQRKTATLYERLPADRYTAGSLSFKLAGRIRSGGDVPPDLLYNAFTEVAMDTFPGLTRCRDDMLRVEAEPAQLSGTGPCLYALASRREEAMAMRALLERRRGWPAYVVEACPGMDAGGAR